jgi:hypothetical protein
MEKSMSLIVVAGKVSHITRVSSTDGAGRDGSISIGTSHQTTFRINGRHVKVKGPMSWVSDDDHITIVGVEEGGVLEPLAAHNHTSGHETYAEASSYTLAIVCLFLGFFTFFITTAIGVWLIWGIKKQKALISKAKQMLHANPQP